MPNASADIIFVIDSSFSMSPCIQAVINNINDFVEYFKESANQSWDLRFDFVSHFDALSFTASSLHCENILEGLYRGQGQFFTRDINQFQNALKDIDVNGDESSCVALDCAIDFPWREAGGCRRIIIFLTDEPAEGGRLVTETQSVLQELIDKIQEQRIMIFFITPESAIYEELTVVDRAEWTVSDGSSGLQDISFNQVLKGIAQTISKSNAQQIRKSIPERRALFGQDKW